MENENKQVDKNEDLVNIEKFVKKNKKSKSVVDPIYTLDGRFLVVKVGNDKFPASDKDITDIENILNDEYLTNLPSVTH